MTIRRADEVIFLEGVCPVEDAEVLIEQLQAGAALIDWSGCTHLHAACFQLLLLARLPVRGTPANPALARWLAPILHPVAIDGTELLVPASEFNCEMET
jgi:hypothetical protein